MSILKLNGITKLYPKQKHAVLEDVSLEIPPATTIAVVGPSGAGKSTLLHIAGLLDTPTEGQVQVNNHLVHYTADKKLAHIRNQNFGFVYQHHHLLREFTALENVLLPAALAGKPNNAQEIRAKKLLERLKLTHRAHAFPHQLSGGERQRVAIARALMNHPKLLLADEPTGNLDTHTAETVANLFTQCVRHEQMSLLLVTHNPQFAQTCDQIYRMGDGVLVREK